MPKEAIVGSHHEEEYHETRKKLIDEIEKKTGLKYGPDFSISNSNISGHDNHNGQMLWLKDGDNQHYFEDSPILIYYDSTYESIDTLDKIIDEWLVVARKDRKYIPIDLIFIPCHFIKRFE